MNKRSELKLAAKPLGSAMDAHHRFLISCVVAVLVFVAMHGRAALATQFVGAWDAFTFTTVVTAWLVMSKNDPYEVRRNARLQDASRTFLFVTVVSAALVSLFAVFILLGSAKSLPPSSFAAHVILSVGAIVLSWTLVHTLFSLRYAHFYYIEARKVDRQAIEGGLIFPGDEDPDYFDFAYFSFIIGMTCQVSDVQISSKTMRRLATIHGLIAFAFNTAILAMFINIVAGLI